MNKFIMWAKMMVLKKTSNAEVVCLLDSAIKNIVNPLKLDQYLKSLDLLVCEAGHCILKHESHLSISARRFSWVYMQDWLNDYRLEVFNTTAAALRNVRKEGINGFADYWATDSRLKKQEEFLLNCTEGTECKKRPYILLLSFCSPACLVALYAMKNQQTERIHCHAIRLAGQVIDLYFLAEDETASLS